MWSSREETAIIWVRARQVSSLETLLLYHFLLYLAITESANSPFNLWVLMIKCKVYALHIFALHIFAVKKKYLAKDNVFDFEDSA